MDNAADDVARRARSARFATMPIVLAGTIAVTAGLTGPVAHAEPRHDDDGAGKRHVDQDRTEQDRNVGHGPVFRTAVARPSTTTVHTVSAVSKAPTTYTVRQGDTVSGIAARFGLSAQDVLVRNGLGWNTIIHPGQTLHLASKPAAAAAPAAAPASHATSGSYHVRSGDTVSGIAARAGVSTSAVLSANGLTQRSVIYPGQTLTIPRAGGASKPAPLTSTAPAAPTRASSVKIAAGDTIGAIAAKHGVSVKALLAANGLSYTSTIYAGGTLVLPSATTKPTTTPAGGAVTTAVGSVNGVELTGEQRRNASTIVAVGRTLGVPDRGIVVALAAAMQESSLRNLPHGDRDSVGLFQQRPSQGWGTKAALQDPATAAELFFVGNPGKTRGLMGVRGWASMSLTQAAQAVQVSAYPNEYAKWEQTARALLSSL